MIGINVVGFLRPTTKNLTHDPCDLQPQPGAIPPKIFPISTLTNLSSTTYAAQCTGYYWDGVEWWYGEKGSGSLDSNAGYGRAVRLVILADD